MEELITMAKAKIKGLDKAIDEVYKNYKVSIKHAVNEAVEKAKDDIKLKAYSCLIEYYNDYPDPSSYNRTYSLSQCFVPYGVAYDNGDVITCDMGIDYDASMLMGEYYGSQKYSPADPEWIIDNYLAGIHPRTDGSSIPGDGDYYNQRYIGDFSPSVEMQRFLDNYWFTFNNNLKKSLAKQTLKIALK